MGVWNERIFTAAVDERARARARANGNRCDEGDSAAKIIGCVASRVVRLLLHVGWKDKVLHFIAI